MREMKMVISDTSSHGTWVNDEKLHRASAALRCECESACVSVFVAFVLDPVLSACRRVCIS